VSVRSLNLQANNKTQRDLKAVFLHNGRREVAVLFDIDRGDTNHLKKKKKQEKKPP
jgi:hypothetical protein